MVLWFACTQGAEEPRQEWLVRRWRKYIKYGELLSETSNPDVRVLVAETQAGQFGCVFIKLSSRILYEKFHQLNQSNE